MPQIGEHPDDQGVGGRAGADGGLARCNCLMGLKEGIDRQDKGMKRERAPLADPATHFKARESGATHFDDALALPVQGTDD